MTADKHLKKIIRQRQAETGERYTTARARVLEAGASDRPQVLERLEAFVLKMGPTSLRLRPMPGYAGEDFTFRTSDGPVLGLVPGASVTLEVARRWVWKKNTYVSGRCVGSHLDVARLRLTPISVREHDETEFEFVDVDPADDPVSDAADLMSEGNLDAAEKLLMTTLVAEFRCIDAHAHLGIIALRRGAVKQARGHFAVGVQIGALSFSDLTNITLPYGWLLNRPFLRALHGHGIASWRLGRYDDALATMQRLIQLDPEDRLGARSVLSSVSAREPWETTDTTLEAN